MNSKIKYHIFSVLEFLFFPIICFILLESLKFGSFIYFFEAQFYLATHILRYLVIAYLIILGISLIIRSFTKNNFVSNSILSIIMLCITLVSYYKYKAIEQPFLPTDIFLAGNLDQITEFGFTGFTFQIIRNIIMLISCLVIDYYINKKLENKTGKITIIKRIIIFVIGVIMTYFLCISPSRYINFSMQNDNKNLFTWMGSSATFFIHLGDFYNPKPDNYSEKTIENIKYQYQEDIQEKEANNPNIILIMNESYADLRKFENVTYSKNPMKIIEEIKQEENCITGNIVTPVLGGGTSLPEFEVLTGLTSYFLPEQIYPFVSYINDDMNSIVRVFNKNNYKTIGIHTNTRTFYNRYIIYDYLGFSQTIFEEDIKNPEYRGNYISDNEAANQIIKAFENNEGNKFIFTVTMQNHMKYVMKDYEEHDIDVYSDVLTDTEIIELQNYTQGVVDANKMYKKLKQYLETEEEDTVLIMFGDHLPILGDSYGSTYEKTGLLGLDYWCTPYIIWANYDIGDEVSIPELVSTSSFGLKLLNIANINDIPWYLKPFYELYEEYPVINNKVIINKEGEKIRKENIEEDSLLINNCEILQYDLLIKNKYIGIY